MAKVDKPRFTAANGRVECDDCPCDEEGVPELQGTGVCFQCTPCPINMETYLTACKLAEGARQ